MQYYPLFIDLTSAHCLIVGAGNVGKRKLTLLLEACPKYIQLIDTSPLTQELQGVLKNPNVSFEQRAFQPADIIGKTLVFAATCDRYLNKTIANCCTTNGILCNIIDSPSDGTFIVPAHINQGDITIAITTHGNSPALSRKLRQDITTWLGNSYIRITTLLSRLRPLVLSSSESTINNSTLFRYIVHSELKEALNQQNRQQCEQLLQKTLPKHLHQYIPELLHELV